MSDFTRQFYEKIRNTSQNFRDQVFMILNLWHTEESESIPEKVILLKLKSS